MELTTEILLEGLAFPESPRWHDDRLWFSDMHARQVMSVGADGVAAVEFAVDQQPSGLGWLPDGRMLVVSMHDRRLLRRDPRELSVVAELGDMAPFHCNDMVVDQLGRAYIGNFGFDFLAGVPVQTTVLILVTPDGHKRIVAEDMLFPNGSVITPDGRTLIIAESYARRLTAFTISPDGSLTERRVWAQLHGASADGICLDAEGAIWVASPVSAEVLRVREGGAITHRIPIATQGIACMLGGVDRRTLFVLSAPLVGPEASLAQRLGRIETVHVDIPGAGLP
ncbi:MAG: SMP-30/gluconolactonase/LRE family protein [Proteobacteria bacterium]|nr:SMP-30/gluconolactonase/LRE family protein [Pseudomonadota bacterium]